jgi:hypothetical protein
VGAASLATALVSSEATEGIVGLNRLGIAGAEGAEDEDTVSSLAWSRFLLSGFAIIWAGNMLRPRSHRSKQSLNLAE